MDIGCLSTVVKEETDREVRAYNADLSLAGELEQTAYLAGAGYRKYLRNLGSPSGTVWDEVRDAIESYGPDVVGVLNDGADVRVGVPGGEDKPKNFSA